MEKWILGIFEEAIEEILSSQYFFFLPCSK
jgi:hypothetical protein